MVTPEVAETIKATQRQKPPVKEPLIKAMLEQAIFLQNELTADPTLTRSALARKRGLEPTVVTRLLRLTNLVPEIQDYIRSMRPSTHRGRITLRRLVPLARSTDRQYQLEEFLKLLAAPHHLKK